MSESSFSVLDYDEDVVNADTFLIPYIMDENASHDVSSATKSSHNQSAMNYINSLAPSIKTAWKTFLTDPSAHKVFDDYTNDEDLLATGVAGMLTAMFAGHYHKLNQYVKLCLLVIQIDILQYESFDDVAGDNLPLLTALGDILDCEDNSYLYQCYLNLVPLVIEPFLEAFEIRKFFATLGKLTPRIVDFYDLHMELKSFYMKKQLINGSIEDDLKNLIINDCTLDDMLICNVLNKEVDKDGNVVNTVFGKSDTVIDDLKCFSGILYDEILSEINDNYLTKHIRQTNANLLSLPTDFANVNQQERLSLKYLSHMSQNLDKDFDQSDIKFFCHRNVLTNLIMAIHDRNEKGVNFRVYKHKDNIFIQPIEDLRRSDDYKTNPSVRAGFGFEKFLCEEDVGNSCTYLMNKFTLSNNYVFVQSEIDACAEDGYTMYELKTISSTGYNDPQQLAAKCLRSWAQNFFIPGDRETLLGIRSKKHHLTHVAKYTQSELVNVWNRYYAEDKAHLRSHRDITNLTLESMSFIFDYIRISVTRVPLKENNILVKNFNVKYKKEVQAVHPSSFYSHVYDLSAKKDVASADLFVRQGLEALFSDHQI